MLRCDHCGVMQPAARLTRQPWLEGAFRWFCRAWQDCDRRKAAG